MDFGTMIKLMVAGIVQTKWAALMAGLVKNKMAKANPGGGWTITLNVGATPQTFGDVFAAFFRKLASLLKTATASV